MGSLNINGRAVAVQAEPDMPLLWVLRCELGMTGTKFGCGLGICGACTIHVDGEPSFACQTLMSSSAHAEDHDHRRLAGPRSTSIESRVDRSRRGAVRLLPERAVNGGLRVAQAQSQTHRRRHRHGDVAHRVPLRDLSTGTGGNPPGGGKAPPRVMPPTCFALTKEPAARAQPASNSTTATTAVKMPMQPPSVATFFMNCDIHVPVISGW